MPLGFHAIADWTPVREDSGIYSLGRAITDTLRVSPNGTNNNGSSWTEAYTTIQAALDAASTDGDDCTLILVSPHTTNYDIDTTGDPTWAANVILQGTHRNWTSVKNTHASATSIMKLTGKSTVFNLNFHLGTENNGLIMTKGGLRVYKCQFVGLDLTSTATALWLDTDSKKHAKVIDCDFLGEGTTQMTALLIDQLANSLFKDLRFHDCKTGIQIVGTNADSNFFCNIDIGNSGIGFDIDAGNEQHFCDVVLHGNTTNIDDEVGDHTFVNMFGHFPVTIEPTNLTGVQVDCGAADTYGSDTQIRAAATSTVPFRIVGVHLEPSASEWYKVRFSDDSGSTFYDTLQLNADKREGVAHPSGTEYIFNKDTRISASAKSVTGGNNVKVWLEIQGI